MYYCHVYIKECHCIRQAGKRLLLVVYKRKGSSRTRTTGNSLMRQNRENVCSDSEVLVLIHKVIY